MESSTELAELSPEAPASLPVPTPGACALPASPVSLLVQKEGESVGAIANLEANGLRGVERPDVVLAGGKAIQKR